MIRYSVGMVWVSLVAASLAVVAVCGCGDSSSTDAPEAPSVTRTSPADDSSGVNLNPVVSVWFDRAMDPASLDTLTVSVGGAAPYEVVYDDSEHRADLHLRAILDPGTEYSAAVSGAVKSAEGATLGSDFQFQFTTGPLDCDHLRDWAEPNDSPETAALIEVGKRYRLLSSCGSGRYDYYKFTVTEPSMITIRCHHVYSSVPQISWYENFLRADGAYYVTMGVWFMAGSIPTHSFSFLPGTYCIQVGNTEPDENIGIYDLELEVGAACADDDLEDNDFFDEAAVITAGSYPDLRGCRWDSDYYAVSLLAGQTLTATVTDLVSTGGAYLRIYNPAGGEVATNNRSLSPQTAGFQAEVDGVHHILVLWMHDNRQYDLDVSIAD